MLEDTLKAFDDFKNKQNGDRTQMLERFLLDKINGTKNDLFLLSRAPTQPSIIIINL